MTHKYNEPNSKKTFKNFFVSEISPEDYKIFLDQASQNGRRFFYQQTQEYTLANIAAGYKCLILGLFATREDKSKELIAAAKILLLRYKKFFYSAECAYGPIVKETLPNEAEILTRFADSAYKFLRKKSKKVLRFRLCPLVLRHLYHEYKRREDEKAKLASKEAENLDKLMQKKGFKLLANDFFTDISIQPRYLFVKKIYDMSFFEIKKSLNSLARRNIKITKSLDIQTRLLGLEELHIYDEIMRDTVTRTGMKGVLYSPYFAKIMPNFKDCYISLAYIDCHKSLEGLEKSKKEIVSKLAKIEATNGANSENIYNEYENQLKSIEKRIALVEEMKTKSNIFNLSAAVFLFSQSDAIYLQSASNEYGLATRAVYKIHEDFLKLASEKKCSFYNFFAVSGQYDENAADYGVMKFKLNFKGDMEEYVGTYEKKASTFFIEGKKLKFAILYVKTHHLNSNFLGQFKVAGF